MKNEQKKKALVSLMRILYFVPAMVLLFTIPVHAYIDPSVMTYAIQAFAGIAIALGTFFGLYWRKVLKKLREIFHVAGKKAKRESDELVFDDPKQPHVLITPGNYKRRMPDIPKDEREINVSSVKENNNTEHKRTWKDVVKDGAKAALAAIALSGAFSFMMLYFAPMEIYMANQDEFWFDLSVLKSNLLPMALAAFIVIVLFYAMCYLIHRKLYIIMLVFGMCVLVTFYLHGTYLAGVLPPMDGTEIVWSDYLDRTILSTIAMFCCIVMILFIWRTAGTRRFVSISVFISLLITGMLGTALVSISKEPAVSTVDEPHTITTDNMLTYSSDRNVIIIILDAVESSAFQSVINEDPSLVSVFDGFTFYPDTVGCYPFTSRALPFILTGEWYENDIPYQKYSITATSNSLLLKTLQEQGYRMGIYEHELLADNDYTRYDNVLSEQPEVGDTNIFKILEAKLAWFKYAPFIFKKYADIDTTEFAELRKVKSGSIEAEESEVFSWGNIRFNTYLSEHSVEVTDQKCFRFIHLEGAHVPFNMNADLDVDTGYTYEDKIRACITIMNTYLTMLKEAGVYDNSAIMIMSDHGFNYDAYEGRQSPMLMVKGVGETGDLKTSNAPISYDDLQTAYQRMIAGQPASELFDAKEGDVRERRFLQYEYGEEDHLVEYIQTGYATDWSTMVATGNVYDYVESEAEAEAEAEATAVTESEAAQ